PGTTAASGGGSGSVRLVGTGRHGGERFAIVEDVASKRQDVVRIGDPPAGEAARTASPAAPPSAAADDQVRKIGEDRYLVAQAEVEHSMDNLSDLFTQLRAVPNQENGQTNGFKVFAIKRGSIFQKIGIENNDVVQI